MTLIEEFLSTLDKKSFGDENLMFSPFPNVDLAGRFPLDENIEKLFDKIYREAIFEEVYFKCNIKPLPEMILREMKISKDILFNDIMIVFQSIFKDKKTIPPDEYVAKIVDPIIEKYLNLDKQKHNSEGLIPIPDENHTIRAHKNIGDRAIKLDISAFVDIVIIACTNVADKTNIQTALPYQKYFYNTFATKSPNQNLKQLFKQYLISILTKHFPGSKTD